MSVRRSAQGHAVDSFRLKSAGNTELQRNNNHCVSSRAIIWLRERRYLRLNSLAHPILVLHIATHRSDEPSIAVEEVRYRLRLL